jgi:hypothetical protein
MSFNQDIKNIKFIANGKSVEVVYDHSIINQNPNISFLMQKMMQNIATTDEVKEFKTLWQNRVEEIFKNQDIVVKII